MTSGSQRPVRGSAHEGGPVDTPASQQALISAIFDASARAVDRIARHAPGIDRERAEYALATVLLEETWVAGRYGEQADRCASSA